MLLSSGPANRRATTEEERYLVDPVAPAVLGDVVEELLVVQMPESIAFAGRIVDISQKRGR